LLQIGMGIARAGSLSAFFPSSVIKGLLAAIGVLLILKQFPHILGHDSDPEGEMSFSQPDDQNTFSEIGTVLLGDIHYGAAVVGIASILLLVIWYKVPFLKRSLFPAPLMVVLFGVVMQAVFQGAGAAWEIGSTHLVQIPALDGGLIGYLTFPDFSVWSTPAVYVAAVTIAIVASLETLLNLEAVDKLDPEQRTSPSSRELIAQGIGNSVSGLIGGLPVTSVIVRSSVNVNMGAKTKLSAVFHGVLLLSSVLLFPAYLNRIPLAALAAILLVTGFRLASLALFRQMWNEGRYQFAPFLITLLSIVFTDLLIGVLIGLFVSVLFILNSSLRRPVRRIIETKIAGDVLHIELANQVSFLNRAALVKMLDKAPGGADLLIDASHSDYIDPDILSLIREFKTKTAPARGLNVRLRGFREKYKLENDAGFSGFTISKLLDGVTPTDALAILREGNRRFQTGQLLSRDANPESVQAAQDAKPMVAVLSCSDFRVSPEVVFDMGMGDVFSVRVAGSVVGKKSLGSLEYAVNLGGVKVIVVLGHTGCGAVGASVDALMQEDKTEANVDRLHLRPIVNEIIECATSEQIQTIGQLSDGAKADRLDELNQRSVEHTVVGIVERSVLIRDAVERGDLLVLGAVYDMKSGSVRFMNRDVKQASLEKDVQW
jgi:carbonic anhydrase